MLNSRVSSRRDEIETAVHPGVRDALLSGDVDLLLQELLILLIDILRNGLPAVGIGEKKEAEEEGKDHLFWGVKSIVALLNHITELMMAFMRL